MAAALVRVGFEHLRLPFLEIRCAKSNVGSALVPERLGFRLEATLPGRVPLPDGRLEDALIYALHAADYPKTPAATRVIAVHDHDR